LNFGRILACSILADRGKVTLRHLFRTLANATTPIGRKTCKGHGGAS
jgi:hypothetical protein